jgi:hypothetical protein
LRGLVLMAIVVMAAGCERDDGPIERLQVSQPPATQQIAFPRAPAPLPPPPPPRGDETTTPPLSVSATIAHAGCRVTINHVAETAGRSAEFVERLGRSESWSTGVIGCVSNAPDKIALECGDASLTIFDSCNNIFDATETQIGTWTTKMADWFHGWQSSAAHAPRSHSSR